MTILNAEALAEIEIFKEFALAIKTNDYDAIANSKHLMDRFERSQFYNKDGSKLPNFDTLVSDRVFSMFELESLANCSAYEIDTMVDPNLSECNEQHRIAKVENEGKYYSKFRVLNGDYITGEVVLSNHGEFKMYVKDGDNTILSVDSVSISSSSLFYNLAESAQDYSDKADDPYVLENRIAEDLHYFKVSKLSEFDNKKDYLNYKINHLLAAIESKLENEWDHDSHEEAYELSSSFLSELESSDKPSSYIILDDELMIENNGSVCIIDFNEADIKIMLPGEEFEFRGETHIAGPHVLEAVDMQIYDDEQFEFSHREVEPEPVIKKTKTLKPGR